jgi:hypothetical protein
MPIPPLKVQKAAAIGLLFRRKFHRGGTAVGIARARDLSNGKNVSMKTIKRMYSFFSRHAVDSQKIGFYKGEPGYPTNGAIAWMLWGNTEAWRWTAKILGKRVPVE